MEPVLPNGYLKCVSAVVILCLACPALAVVLHPDANSPADRPDDSVVGRWADNGTCVVIGSQYVLTTRHQGGGLGSMVQIGDANYYVDQVWTYDEPNRADLRIARLAGANLTDYAQINSNPGEASGLWQVVIGGYGKGRGADLTDSNGVVFGYGWDSNANDILRWGQNRLQGSIDNSHDPIYDYYVDLVYDDFDKPGHFSGYDGEAALAEYDSGNGWFTQIDGNWHLVGLGYSVPHADTLSNWFDDPNTLSYDPEYNYAIRISQYAGWINGIIPEPATCAILAAGAAVLFRRRSRPRK
ncbi:MAG TPA: PEP-CTERM sorting domain-containing protein [Phycisphaerae bacterium]|nr:PEP-CTERM sorting domain-containing protein [Phycisphaerae bacterium]